MNAEQTEIANSLEKCQSWLESCSLDNESEATEDGSEDSSSIFTETTESSESYYFTTSVTKDALERRDNKMGQIITHSNPPTKPMKCKIYKSEIKNLHLGDVTNFNAPVVIYPSASLHIRAPPLTVPNDHLLLDRKNWLAQPPLAKPEMLEGPAQYVVICHTATDEGFCQPDNMLLVRLTQMFHIECRKWDDIAYNFLVGSDGNVYEGRGWNAVGSHTFGYNVNSVGIAFVGCFINHKPPEVSLIRCKNLIKQGVRIGAIAKDYSLVGHCQCSPTASPGKSLFEEIKTWSNWNRDISVAQSEHEVSKNCYNKLQHQNV
uniref:Peptidoglycan-recognition protein LE n=1 Tax=Lasioderma serricorne TaxID=295660 RepID=A0A9E8Z1R1_9COLE|nr:peptidoglycan-recognition protein LE [Lasioderma serricorne]